MSEFKGTPGPWEGCRDSKCQCRLVWSIPGDVPVFTSRGSERALVGLAHHKWGDSPDLIYGQIPEEETFANARLIAAAPDLLQALQECLERGGTTPGEWVPQGTYDKAHAAIAKALGEKA